MKASIVFFFIICLILVALAICYFVYKAIINRQLQSYREGHPLEKKHFPSLTNLLLIGIIILGISYVLWEGEKTQELLNTISNLEGKVQSLSFNIQSLESQLTTSALKEESYLSGCEVTLEGFSADTGTMNLSVRLSLKESSSDTKVSIHYLGQDMELSESTGGAFSGIVHVPVSKAMPLENSLAVSIRHGENIKTEYVSERLFDYPSYDACMEQCFLNFYVSTVEGKLEKNSVHYQNKGYIDVKASNYATLESAELVIKVRDKEVYRNPVNISGEPLQYSIDKRITFDSPDDGEYVNIYLDATDSNGYRYLVSCSHMESVDNESYMSDDCEETRLFAPDGTELYFGF